MERTPSIRTEGIERLAIRGVFLFSCWSQQPWRRKLFANGIVQLRQGVQTRRYRDRLDCAGDMLFSKRASFRRFHDQGNMHRGVVDEETVLFFSVIPK